MDEWTEFDIADPRYDTWALCWPDNQHDRYGTLPCPNMTYGPLHNRSVAHPFLLAAFHSKFIGDCSTLRLSRSLDHFR